MKGTIVILITSLLAAQSAGCKAGGADSTGKGAVVNATVETSMGNFELELYASDAPKTVANFVGLAKQHYYDGISIHRVSKGFVIQTGDSTGTGAGGRSIYKKEFEDELNPKTPSYQAGYVKGTLAMANRGPNTNTSQFFVVLQDAPWLPKSYTIFGKVTEGMDVVEKIGGVEVIPQMSATDGRPKVRITVMKVTVRDGEK